MLKCTIVHTTNQSELNSFFNFILDILKLSTLGFLLQILMYAETMRGKKPAFFIFYVHGTVAKAFALNTLMKSFSFPPKCI